jgi:hypothetical protein
MQIRFVIENIWNLLGSGTSTFLQLKPFFLLSHTRQIDFFGDDRKKYEVREVVALHYIRRNI